MEIKKAQVLSASNKNLDFLADYLKCGGLIGIPTETVYGLAASVFQTRAIERIYEVKKRPRKSPLILHLADSLKSFEAISKAQWVDAHALNPLQIELAQKLMESFWPGPLTLIFPASARIPAVARGGQNSIGIRIPDHRICQELLYRCEQPLLAPSANRFGRISPTSSRAVISELGEQIEWILEGGACSLGLESSILSFCGEAPVSIVRYGSLSLERLENKLGIKIPSLVSSSSLIQDQSHHTAQLDSSLHSPGQSLSHYSPEKKLLILDQSLGSMLSKGIFLEKLKSLLGASPWPGLGILSFSGTSGKYLDVRDLLPAPIMLETLSLKGDEAEMARNFFQSLRALDEASSVELILAEPCPYPGGLGRALKDRLKRASHKNF